MWTFFPWNFIWSIIITKGLIRWLFLRCSNLSFTRILFIYWVIFLNHWRLSLTIDPVHFLIKLYHRKTWWHVIHPFLKIRKLISMLQHMITQNWFTFEYWLVYMSLFLIIISSSGITFNSLSIIILIQI